MTMRKLGHFLTFAALLVSVSTMSGHAQGQGKADRQKSDPKKLQELMRKKLDHAQKLLGAIAMNKLDDVVKNADALVEVSKEAEWKVYKTPQFEMNSDDFRRSAEKLSRQAKAKDLDSAKLTYLEMTMTCFHCHRYVRDVGMARFEGDEGH